MDFYAMYLAFCLVVKLAFVYFVIKMRVKPTEKDSELLHQTEKLFTVLMALLIVYLFHPGHKTDVKIDGETKFFLFLFGLLMFIDIMKLQKKETTEKKKSHS